MIMTKAKKTYKLYKDYIGKDFESSSQTTKEFTSFSTKLRNAVKEQLEINGNWELHAWNKGHFYCSAFLKNKVDGTFMYISISDVRHFKNEWYEKMLYRTAVHEKDYTGGRNQYCRLDQLNEVLK